MEQQKKILTISLADRRKFKCYAAFNGEALIIYKLTEVGGLLKAWKKELIEEVKERQGQGFTVLVEERTDHIAPYGHRIMLEDKDEEEGRIQYAMAFDWYFALDAIGGIHFPPEMEKYRVRDSYVEKLADDQGRTKYNVNWDSITGAHRAVLLAVLAACHDRQSAEWVEAVYGYSAQQEDNDNPLKRWANIIKNRDMAEISKWERIDQERMKGQ